MLDRTLVLGTIAACMLATPAAAQAPAPTTTALDGAYVGTATLTAEGHAGDAPCGTITSAYMTITDGQVVIHEIFFNGGRPTYRGSVNASGEVSALRPPDRMVTGTIHDSIFTGQDVYGHASYRCNFSVQMQKATGSTAFDGEYIGVSRESSKTASASGAECPPSHVPAPLTIINGVVLGLWEGSISPQGAMVMRNTKFSRVDAQIDPAGTIKGQYGDSACTVTFVWRKQSR